MAGTPLNTFRNIRYPDPTWRGGGWPMVDALLLVGQTLITVFLSVVTLWLLSGRLIQYNINRFVKKKLVPYKSMIKQGATSMQQNGVEIKQVDNLEKQLMDAVMENNPEIQGVLLVLDNLGEKGQAVADAIRENPKIGLALYQRVYPFVQKFGQGLMQRQNPQNPGNTEEGI